MVRLNKIYTRTGDAGETGLVDGSRASKADPRFAAIGDVDEANTTVGVALLGVESVEARAMLGRIQNELFDLGADLATPAEIEGALRIQPGQIDRLEREIDAMNATLKPLDSFVLPGGSTVAAHLHLARTVARRAEREITLLAAAEPVNPAAIRYINRLSDHLFVASRYANDGGKLDVLWLPGQNRGG